MQDFLVIDNVRKSFGSLRAVDGVSLSVAQGEVFSLLGPSGCGKTTLLRMLAGFETPNAGRILLRGKEITAQPPEHRPINTVFQNYALFPHLDVWGNIAFGLRMARKGKAQIESSVSRMLALVQLEEHARKKPAQLSGGQRQRVAIARALVNEPEVLLLDEPLAALDLKLRQHLLSELTALHRKVGTTFIYVTHDQGEAMGLSHRIAVMNRGIVEQVAGPRDLYETPASLFVASFIGDANLMRGTILGNTATGELRVHCGDLGEIAATGHESNDSASDVTVIVRPERIGIHQTEPAGERPENLLRGTLSELVYFGSHARARVDCPGMSFTAVLPGTINFRIGDKIWLGFSARDARLVAI